MIFVLAEPDPAAPAQPQGGSPFGLVIFMVLILAIWWLLVLRPQSKAAKAQRAKLDAIQKGDRVRTRGGIEGVVVRVQDDKVILKIDVEGKVHVPFAKAYIEDVVSEEPAPETKETK
jgi:preprotein translocase subunit YajC